MIFKKMILSFRIVLVIIICELILSGCATSIRRIYKDPVKLDGKKVTVRGRVISALDLKDLNCFTVRNRTGKILVVTDYLLPLKNDRIRVRGVVDRQFNYKNQTIIVIKEKKLKDRKAPPSKKILEKL